METMNPDTGSASGADVEAGGLSDRAARPVVRYDARRRGRLSDQTQGVYVMCVDRRGEFHFAYRTRWQRFRHWFGWRFVDPETGRLVRWRA